MCLTPHRTRTQVHPALTRPARRADRAVNRSNSLCVARSAPFFTARIAVRLATIVFSLVSLFILASAEEARASCNCSCDQWAPCDYTILDGLFDESGGAPSTFLGACGSDPQDPDVEVRHANLFQVGSPYSVTHVCVALRSPTGQPDEPGVIQFCSQNPADANLPGAAFHTTNFLIRPENDHQVVPLVNPQVVTGSFWVVVAYPTAQCNRTHQGARSRTAGNSAVYVQGSGWRYYDTVGGAYAGRAPVIRPLRLGPESFGVIVQPPGPFTTSESGGSAQFTVALAGEPYQYVAITLTSSDPSEGVPTPDFLWFDTSNWAIPQTVTVTGIDDSLADGDVSYTINFALSTLDPCYGPLQVPPVILANLDDEGAGNGACCLGDGCCRILSPSDCSDQGGTFQGAAAACSPNPCPPARPDHADHNLGDVTLTITDQGTVGFLDDSQTAGSGLVFPAGGSNHLYIGGLWVGVDPTYVANRDYLADPDRDWQPSACPDGRVRQILPGASDQDLQASFDDGGGSTPRGIHVDQVSWAYAAPPNDGFVIVTYAITNTGTGPLNEIYAGLFLDFDLFTAGWEDEGSADLTRDLVAMTDAYGYYTAVRLLQPAGPLHPVANVTLIDNEAYVWPTDFVLEADKYAFLAASDPAHVLHTGPGDHDYGALVSVGPFSLAPGDVRTVAFAVIAATDLSGLLARADQAQALYLAPSMDAPTPELAGSIRPELRVAPNPIRDQAEIRFRLPVETEGEVGVFDPAGRRVRLLWTGRSDLGERSIPWDGRDAAGRRLPSGTYWVRVGAEGGVATAPVLLLR